MAKLDDRQAFSKCLITHLLFIFTDESTYQNSSLSSGKDASIHIIFTFLIRELSPNMYCLQRIIQPFEVSYGREFMPLEKHIALNGKTA